jgi:Rod binding domain-containing protein
VTTPISGGGTPSTAAEARRLLDAARALEGVFYQQMLQAMRDAVPEGGVLEASAGEKVFQEMFDEEMARQAAAQNERGLAQALYRQLARHLPADPGATAGQPGMAEARDGTGPGGVP